MILSTIYHLYATDGTYYLHMSVHIHSMSSTEHEHTEFLRVKMMGYCWDILSDLMMSDLPNTCGTKSRTIDQYK